MQVGPGSGNFRQNRVGPGRIGLCEQKIVEFLSTGII